MVVGLALLCSAACARAGSTKYKFGDPVPTYVNKIGPASNPTELYRYHSLPFCRPSASEAVEKTLTLGEVMENNRMVRSLYDIRFRADNHWVALCNKRVTKGDVAKFKRAISRAYVYEMVVDDLPVYGYVGRTAEVEEVDPSTQIARNVTRYYLYTHVTFHMKYSPQDEVISADAAPDALGVKDITVERDYDLEFSYGVDWKETDIPYAKRMDKYIHYPFFQHDLRIQWFSIVNSLILVLLLTGLVGLILLRILRNDMQRYLSLDEEFGGPDDPDESGWKLLHGDVFRLPEHPSLLAACLGAGAQIILVLGLLLMALLMLVLYPLTNRGSVQSALVFLYATTAGVAGFVAGSMRRKFVGEQQVNGGGAGSWPRNAVLTATLFFGPLFLVFCFLNSVAIAYGSISALPAGTIVLFAFLWILLTVPLTIGGAILGKNISGPLDPPCRARPTKREIPERPWYNSFTAHFIIAGFLPFSAVFIEAHYVFDAVWGTKMYTLFGILGLTFLILLCVVSCLSITLIYFTLNGEDWRWWWSSFLMGGSPALFLYGYCFYYFSERTDFSGLLQVAWFFGYNAVGCYALFLALGTVGFFSCYRFIRSIYATIKAS